MEISCELYSLSLSDYPGHCSFVIFLRGCFFTCPYCHNSHLRSREGKETTPLKSLLQQVRRNVPIIDSVVITGGEPTEHPNLQGLIEKLKSLDLLLKLDSNGNNYETLESVIPLLDFLAIDLKTTKDQIETIGGGLNCFKSLQLISTIPHEIRITMFPPLVPLNRLTEMVKYCPTESNIVIQQYFPTSNTKHIPPYSFNEVQTALEKHGNLQNYQITFRNF